MRPPKPQTIPRTEDNLTAREREIYEALPDSLRTSYLRQLPELKITRHERIKQQRLISERLALMNAIIAGCEKKIRDLRSAWAQLERHEEVNFKDVAAPPTVEGATITLHRKQQPQPEPQPQAQEPQPKATPLIAILGADTVVTSEGKEVTAEEFWKKATE